MSTDTQDTSIITCPHCHRKNRVAMIRREEKPKCGACKAALFIGKPVNLTLHNFKAHVSSDLPTLVDFWAPWCGPCLQFAPLFEQVAKKEEPWLRCAKIDTEAEQQLGAQFAIRSIPTLILFKQGKELDRISGALPPTELARWIARVLDDH